MIEHCRRVVRHGNRDHGHCGKSEQRLLHDKTPLTVGHASQPSMEKPIQRPIKTIDTHKVRDTPHANFAKGGAGAPSFHDCTERYGMKCNINMFMNAAAISTSFI